MHHIFSARTLADMKTKRNVPFTLGLHEEEYFFFHD